MAVNKLTNNIQSLFCSSINLFSYKRAVEELVYNALDAKSTSIAIRINIQERKIQVIDNGNGINTEDFILLGQRYATSKFVDMSTFKSAPNSYGFRGQALASVIAVSKCVKITSRTITTEKTWSKTFHKGKEIESKETISRPSKGTTVEINDFLYNMNIQSKSVDHVCELNDIKSLLDQLSMVHNNVSISLRDDSNNDIVFQIHKNRDIYQTLKCLHNIDKSDVQELQVEKGEYKAKAYIAKKYDHLNRHHLLFLNKKVIQNTNLHKLAQDGLKKSFHPTRVAKKLKSKNIDYVDESDILKNHNSTPFYFIFITCPYYDYAISNTPKQSTLEFKNWNQINTLIEKVVKFYTGDLRITEIKKNENTEVCNQQDDDTRNKVRQIIKKILGSNSKKPGVSQMQNGVKGKLIKRKNKSKTKKSISKVKPSKCRQNNVDETVIAPKFSNQSEIKEITKINNTHIQPKPANILHKNSSILRTRKMKCKINDNVISNKNHHKYPKHRVSKIKKKKVTNDALIKAFERQTETNVKRCNLLAREVEKNHNALKKSKRKQRIVVNETINYSNIIKNNENISIRNRVQETIIHDYIPLKPNECRSKNEPVANINDFKTSHDLVTTVLAFQNIPGRSTDNQVPSQDFNKEQNYVMLPQLTYQSHQYNNKASHYSNITNEICYENYDNAELRNYKSYVREDSFSKRFTDTFAEATLSPILVDEKNARENYFHKTKHRSRGTKMLSKKATFCFPDISDTSHLIDIQIKDHMPREYNLHVTNDNESLQHIPISGDSEISHSKDRSENKVRKLSENNHTVINNDRTFEVVDIIECSIPNTVTTKIGLTHTLTKSHSKDYLKPSIKHTNRTPKDSVQQSIIRHCKIKDILTNKMENQQAQFNVIFLSNSKTSTNENDMNACEAILDNDNLQEFAFQPNIANMFNDSLLNLTTSQYFDLKNHEGFAISGDQIMTPEKDEMNAIFGQEMEALEELIQETLDDGNIQNIEKNNAVEKKKEQENTEDHLASDLEYFNINNRLRFLPKGMSQIFKTCNSKNTNVFGIDNDYFEEDLYNRFVENIEMRTEIYEQHVQNPNDVTSKAIDKVNCKLNQESSSLTFNSHSLEEAKVLGQVDSKFIATVMKGATESSDFLVLFDQHAVHERIRLEQNLSDYYNGNTWNSVKVDDVLLKLPKDEIMYLHNYKDKFTQFGLHWTLLNNQELTLHAIPEAILGKNLRQVEKVINAVKSLITEQTEIIRAQKGCVFSYPKSIMDLVFSEACRHAIMFGHRLSKNECLELIRNLATCKTPFQCAHGRPVMAVIMDIKFETRNYSIHLEKLRHFCSFKKQAKHFLNLNG